MFYQDDFPLFQIYYCNQETKKNQSQTDLKSFWAKCILNSNSSDYWFMITCYHRRCMNRPQWEPFCWHGSLKSWISWCWLMSLIMARRLLMSWKNLTVIGALTVFNINRLDLCSYRITMLFNNVNFEVRKSTMVVCPTPQKQVCGIYCPYVIL